MKGFVADIEDLTQDNTDFRRVLYTGHNLQLVVMSLDPGEEIGEEVHDDRDQFFRIEEGEGVISIDGVDHPVKDDDGVIVPQGARHNVRATGDEPLKLYTIYGRRELHAVAGVDVVVERDGRALRDGGEVSDVDRHHLG